MATEHPHTPPPGSGEAIEQGCRCPRWDNRRGEGYVGPSAAQECRATAEQPNHRADARLYVVNADCPVHSHITAPDPAHNPAERRSDAAPGEPHTRAHPGEAA